MGANLIMVAGAGEGQQSWLEEGTAPSPKWPNDPSNARTRRADGKARHKVTRPRLAHFLPGIQPASPPAGRRQPLASAAQRRAEPGELGLPLMGSPCVSTVASRTPGVGGRKRTVGFLLHFPVPPRAGWGKLKHCFEELQVFPGRRKRRSGQC